MIITLVLYVVAIASGVFFVLYKDLLSLILFCTVIVALFVLFLAYALTKVRVQTDDSVVNISTPIKLTISVKNRSPFAITSIKLTAKCTNLFLNTEYDCRFVVSAKPFSENVFTYEMKSEHIGNIEVKIKKAVFNDFFSMFRLQKKLGFNKVLTVLPQTASATAELRPNNYFTSDSENFSNSKAGDDPSEIFNIREYAPGDKMNKIHWKLTSKMDNYMVKDYSLPVSEAVIIYADLGLSSTDDEQLSLIDSLLKSLMSISEHFIKSSIAHYIGWYDCRTRCFNKQKITKTDDLYLTMRRMLSDSIFTTEAKMEKCDYFLKKKYSHIVMLTAKSPSKIVSAFSGFDIQISQKSVVCISNKSEEIPDTAGDTLFIPVIPGREDTCLYGIKL